MHTRTHVSILNRATLMNLLAADKKRGLVMSEHLVSYYTRRFLISREMLRHLWRNHV
jgi:hypothetical protein